jgi:hypothetical protein
MLMKRGVGSGWAAEEGEGEEGPLLLLTDRRREGRAAAGELFRGTTTSAEMVGGGETEGEKKGEGGEGGPEGFTREAGGTGSCPVRLVNIGFGTLGLPPGTTGAGDFPPPSPLFPPSFPLSSFPSPSSFLTPLGLEGADWEEGHVGPASSSTSAKESEKAEFPSWRDRMYSSSWVSVTFVECSPDIS